MLKLRDGIIELYRKVATSIPTDVEDALKATRVGETEPFARESLETILKNISRARTSNRPICQDTGFPVFFVKVPIGLSQRNIRDIILDATRLATQKVPLRANAVSSITDKNSGDNVGDSFPMIYIEETDEQTLSIDLMLKGGGSENLGQIYKLPARLYMGENEFVADRGFDGIKKCVLDALFNTRGKECPPYTIAVAIGGSRDQVSYLSKRQLMRRLHDVHPDPVLAAFESKLLEEVNSLSVRPSGFDGQKIVLGVKIAAAHRHPESYFVDVSLACWANRRGKLVW